MKVAPVLLALTLLGTEVAAQMAPVSRVPVIQPDPGQRVRLNYGIEGSTPVQGTWVALDPHGVRVLAAAEDTVQVALDRLVSLERSTGTKRHTGTGLLAGAVIGMVLGLALAPEDEAAAAWGTEDYSKMYYAGLGSLIGGLAGGVIGASMKSERWETVPLRPAGM